MSRSRWQRGATEKSVANPDIEEEVPRVLDEAAARAAGERLGMPDDQRVFEYLEIAGD
jgi:hypothetical protein